MARFTGAGGGSGIPGPAGADGADGADGANGADGADGQLAGLKFTYNSGSGAQDPGEGKFSVRRNSSVTFNPSISILFSTNDANGNLVNSILGTWDDNNTDTVRGTITITRADSLQLAVWNVTGNWSTGTYYSTMPVTYSGGATSFVNGEDYFVTFTRSGAKGADGADGAEGPAGADGAEGPTGPEGEPGTFEYWDVYESRADLLADTPPQRSYSIISSADADNGTVWFWDGIEWTLLYNVQGPAGPAGTNGQDGANGEDGLSAYEVAVGNGFVGTEAEWLLALVGPQGIQGIQGVQGDPGPAGANGADGVDGVNGADGADGQSAYEVAVSNGFSGTESEWLTSLIGATGAQGIQGEQGPAGPEGPEGPQGIQGIQGEPGADGGSTGLFPYKVNTTTTTGDPGHGYGIWNTVGQTDATILSASHIDRNGVDVNLFLHLLQENDYLIIQDESNSSNYQRWQVTGSITEVDGSYDQIPATYIDGGHIFSNNDFVVMVVIRQGIVGEGVPAGGTTGQVLSKASGDDYDTAWVSPANLPFVTYAKDSDQDVSGGIVTFPTSSSLSGGASFGSMASTGVFTFSETGNYLITVSFNTSATGTSNYADLDIWGRVNGSDTQRYTQLATNAMKKGSVSEVVPITAINDTFEWYSNNGCTVYGSGGTRTRINIVKLS